MSLYRKNPGMKVDEIKEDEVDEAEQRFRKTEENFEDSKSAPLASTGKYNK